MPADPPPVRSPRAGGGAIRATVLEREFGAATLSGLRGAVQEGAAAAGLASERVIDVVLALHELAANVIRHGAGRGRLLPSLGFVLAISTFPVYHRSRTRTECDLTCGASHAAQPRRRNGRYHCGDQ